MSKQQHEKIICLTFNQDYGCFACGTKTGFRVFSTQPCQELFRRNICEDNEEGGIAAVEMLFRCNILALFGQRMNKNYPPNKVMIWDDYQQKCIGELTFRSPVHSVKLRRDKVAVALMQKVLVYNFADLKLIHQIETCENKEGLLSFSSTQNSSVLVCPGMHPGDVRVTLYDIQQTKFIKTHNSHLSALTISIDGKIIATASEKGTLIRIFEAGTGVKLQEFRRGTDQAQIYSIAFSANCDWMACSSDKGTIHIFALKAQINSNDQTNQEEISNGQKNLSSSSSRQMSLDPQQTFSALRGYLPTYFNSQRSIAQYRLQQQTKSFVGFGAEGTYSINVLCMNGECHTIEWDPINGGQCKEIAITQFME